MWSPPHQSQHCWNDHPPVWWIHSYCPWQDLKQNLHDVHLGYELQSTLVISKSKGPSETLRDIRTSTYQIWRIEENTNGTTKFHK